jgi:hypothetical protein
VSVGQRLDRTDANPSLLMPEQVCYDDLPHRTDLGANRPGSFVPARRQR